MIYTEWRISEDDTDRRELRLIRRIPSANMYHNNGIRKNLPARAHKLGWCFDDKKLSFSPLLSMFVFLRACLQLGTPGGRRGGGRIAVPHLTGSFSSQLCSQLNSFLLLSNCQQYPSNFLLDLSPLCRVNRQFMSSSISRCILSLSHLPASRFSGQKVKAGSLTPNIWCK